MSNMNTNTQPIQIQVLREGQPDYNYMPQPPSLVEATVSHITSAVTQSAANMLLQAQMGLYDLRMGTNYRTIRNELVRERRNKEFEKKIGLVAVNR